MEIELFLAHFAGAEWAERKCAGEATGKENEA